MDDLAVGDDGAMKSNCIWLFRFGRVDRDANKKSGNRDLVAVGIGIVGFGGKGGGSFSFASLIHVANCVSDSIINWYFFS